MLPLLVEDIQRDRVVALNVASHYYRVRRRQVVEEGLQMLSLPMQLVAGQARRARVTLIVNEDIATNRPSANALRHLAGTTALRLLIGAAASDIENTADLPLARHLPDGLWEYDATHFGPSPGAALEYDAGSYSAKQIEEKIKAFEAYGRQYWGGVTATRAKFITRCAQEARVGCAIFEAPWWEAPPEDFYRYPRTLL